MILRSNAGLARRTLDPRACFFLEETLGVVFSRGPQGHLRRADCATRDQFTHPDPRNDSQELRTRYFPLKLECGAHAPIAHSTHGRGCVEASGGALPW